MRGRFAPTPSGRMHLGNVFAALIAWLSARAEGGSIVLRIEDLDPRAQHPGVADALMRDLEWLGLTWDEGPRWQSERGDDKDAHPTRYQDDRWGNPSDDYDNGYVHNNSTVVGHAAYLMCNDTGLDGESLDTEQMALLVYGTFHALTSDSSFSQFRTCMELTARIMIEQGDLSSENLTRISAAFDAVNIRAADNNDFISDDDEKNQINGNPKCLLSFLLHESHL